MPNLLGKTNLGLNGLYYYNMIMPFINQWKQGGEIQVINGGVNYFTSNPPGTANSAWVTYLDANGDLINPLPANTTHFVRIVYAQAVDGVPAGFTRTGQAWVLEWDGDPSLTISAPLNNQVRNGSRLTGTWTDDTSNKVLTFSNFSLTNPPTNVRFMRADYEPILNQGEIFSLDYLANAKRASGLVRYMDQMATNNNKSVLSYTGMATEAYFTWGRGSTTPNITSGLPPSLIWKFSNHLYSEPWICIPGPFGVAKMAQVTGATQTNPCVISAPGHPFVNGDEVIPYFIFGMVKTATITMTIASPAVVTWTSHGFAAGANVFFTGGTFPTGIVVGQSYYVLATDLTTDTFKFSRTPGGAAVDTSGTQSGTHTGTAQLNRNKFIVQNVVAGVSLELASADSTTFSAYSSGGFLTSPVTLAGLTAQMSLFATEIKNGLNPVLQSYWEYSNEIWNVIFDSFHWLAAQAHNLLDASNVQMFAGDNSFRMAGYISAHFMKTILDVYGASNRSRWRGVLGTQTVNTGVTNDLIVGVNRYIADQAPLLTINDLFNDLAVTGYFGSFPANGSPGAVTIDIPTSVFTRSSHGFAERRPVKFATTNTLPTPLVVGTIYYTSSVTASTFKVAATPGGVELTLGGSQSGTHTVTLAVGDWYLSIISTSVSRFNSGLEPTQYSYYQRVVNEDNLDSRWSGQLFSLEKVIVFWAAQKAIADTNGLGLIQYEGGVAGDIGAFVSEPNFAQIFDFFVQGTYCAECAAVHTAMYNAFIALGGHHPAKYVDSAPATRFGAFGAEQYTNNGNVVWEATCAFNDKIWCGRLR